MPSLMDIDKEQPGYLLAQYMNRISHEIIHNRSDRKSRMKLLGNFCAELRLQAYGQTYLRSSIATLISDLCGDNIESLKTWADQDWNTFREDLISCFKILIRKDARYFFIPGVEGLEESSRKTYLATQKKQILFKNRDVDIKVKEMLSKDFRDVFLRIEVQKALSILRRYIEEALFSRASDDVMQQQSPSQEEQEKIQNYIACVQGTMAFEKHSGVKEALLSFIDQERLCLKERADVVNCFKSDDSILTSHTLEELYIRVETMLRSWEMIVLPKPAIHPDNPYSSEEGTDECDSYILQGGESIDENDDLEEEDEEEEEEDVETQAKPSGLVRGAGAGAGAGAEMHPIKNQKEGTPSKFKTTTTVSSTAQRSEDDASFETAMDLQEERNGTMESRAFIQNNLVEDLVNKRNVLRVDAKDPLESIVQVASTAKLVEMANDSCPSRKLWFEMEDSDVDGEISRTSKSSSRKKRRKSGNTPVKRQRIIESSDDELWEDTEVRYNGGVRRRWTEEEAKAVKDGYEIYGKNWATIKKEFSKVLANRSNVQIKDKFRTMVRTGEIIEEE